MKDTHEIMTIPSYEIGVMREPAAILAEAKVAAQALMTVVGQKSKPVIMNGEQYLEFEDWQTVAKFYGLTAKVVKTTFIDLGGVKGYEATAEAIRLSDGMAISSADAMCLNDEDKWSTRTKYKYENVLDGNGKKIWVPASGKTKGYYKNNKVEDGVVSVPLFQLRSMAQTRACAKTLRNVLAWVVVLAGFKPTVAEEMTGDEVMEESNASGKPVVNMPKEKETETAFTDIISLSQSNVGDIMCVQGYGVSVKHRQVGANKSDISDFTIGDLPKDPTAQMSISAWGKLDAGAGNLIKFKGVKVSEFNGKKTFLAEGGIVNG